MQQVSQRVMTENKLVSLLCKTFSELLFVSVTSAFHICSQRFVYLPMAAEFLEN
jgi:hypothetical protein